MEWLLDFVREGFNKQGSCRVTVVAVERCQLLRGNQHVGSSTAILNPCVVKESFCDFPIPRMRNTSANDTMFPRPAARDPQAKDVHIMVGLL